MKKNSGEVLIGLLVGMAVGAIVLGISADKKAQELANRTGREISGMEVIADQPVQSFVTVITPSLAGAGLGLLIDEYKGGKKDDKSSEVQIQGDGNVVVIENDDGGANGGIDNSDNSNGGM